MDGGVGNVRRKRIINLIYAGMDGEQFTLVGCGRLVDKRGQLIVYVIALLEKRTRTDGRGVLFLEWLIASI